MDKYYNSPDYKHDPVERMKHLVTGLIAGHHNSTTLLKDKVPVDPLLGETLYLEKQGSDIEMYFECVADNP